MKRINYFVMLAAAALMAGCGQGGKPVLEPKVEQTVLVGHFLSASDAPEYVMVNDEDTGEELAKVPVTDGRFRYDIPSDKTTLMSVSFGLDGNGWKEKFIPTGDTVRYEIDGLKTVAEEFAPETSLNFQVRDYVPILKDVLSRLETDSAATSELRDCCLKLIEEHPSDFLGYWGLIYASLAQVTEEEWLALVDKVAPEIQAKPYVQALKAQYAASREEK